MKNYKNNNPAWDEARLKMQNYSIDEHIHNYAVWTAARAVQRKFQGAKTANISKAINDADLEGRFLKKNQWNNDSFDREHEKSINALCESLKDFNCSYGRAAKIIAIYLKTSVIISNNGIGDLSKVIHPPIDRKLLSALKKHKLLFINEKEIPAWTDLKKEKYLEIIDDMRNLVEDLPMWKIEKYWEL